MKAFLDFEASSLSKDSYPIEVAWVFEDGRSESHLIVPAAEWTDWDERAQAVHGLTRRQLVAEGQPAAVVAARMIEALSGHDLFASAPSWDGKWLSALLRATGHPRHGLTLRDTDDALRETAADILRPVLDPAALAVAVHNIVARASTGTRSTPAHRALPDAAWERECWLRADTAARELAAGVEAGRPTG